MVAGYHISDVLYWSSGPHQHKMMLSNVVLERDDYGGMEQLVNGVEECI